MYHTALDTISNSAIFSLPTDWAKIVSGAFLFSKSAFLVRFKYLVPNNTDSMIRIP